MSTPSSPQRQKTQELSKDLEYWMTNLPQKLKAAPIIHLAIPGSHDSFTSSINSDSEIAPDGHKLLRDLQFLGKPLKWFMKNWSKTQDLNATGQLMCGIRYFDLRIATKKGESNMYFVHGLYSDEVQSVLNDIAAFLKTHTQEIVILDCQHFYAFTQNDHEKLMMMLTQTFGTKMLPFTSHMDHVTLEYMTKQFRYQVIVIYRSDAARFGQPLLWPSHSFPNPWPDTVSQMVLFNALEYGLRNRPRNMAYISQCILTPSHMFVFKNLFSDLKKTCAERLEKPRARWIDNQRHGTGRLNVIICDFVDLSNCQYIKEVIGLNEKLLINDTEPVARVINVVGDQPSNGSRVIHVDGDQRRHTRSPIDN